MNTPNTNTKPKATPITGQAPKPAPAAPQTTPTQAATASADPACKTAPKAATRPLEEILAEQIAAQEAELKAKKRKLQTIRQRKAALAKSAERKERAERLYLLGFTTLQLLVQNKNNADALKLLLNKLRHAYQTNMAKHLSEMSEKQRAKANADRALLEQVFDCIANHGEITPPAATKTPQNTPS